MGGAHPAGKGDRYRHVDPKVWSENWDAIFGKRKSPSLDPETEKRIHGRLLRLVMRDLCEKYYGTVWISGWEGSLWAMAQNTKREDGVLLLYLAERCGGWWVWDDLARAEVLIPLDAWKRNYSADEVLEPAD